MTICFKWNAFDSVMVPKASVPHILWAHNSVYLMLIKSVTDLERGKKILRIVAK